MIGRLQGTIVERYDDGHCVLDVQGVGYDVAVPLNALGALLAGEKTVTLHIHTHVREESLALYGFASVADRAAFRMLMSVSSVGPKLAMAIMNVMDARELREVIAQGNKLRFKGIAGVGKKTVERIMLELKDKLGEGLAVSGAPQSVHKAAPTTPLAQVADALMQMGYKRPEAVRAIEAITPAAKDKPVEVLLREALAALA